MLTVFIALGLVAAALAAPLADMQQALAETEQRGVFYGEVYDNPLKPAMF